MNDCDGKNGRRVIVPDTNIFLHDFRAIYAFPCEIMRIPLDVIEEIDDQKRRSDEVGRNARMTSRLLDEIRGDGSLAEGVTLDNGCVLSVEFGMRNINSLPPSLRNNKKDNSILAVALHVQDQFPDRECLFVTKDINMRIKADAIGLKAVDYDAGKIELEELYTGRCDVDVDEGTLDEFIRKGMLPADRLPELFANEIAVLSCGDRSAAGRFDAQDAALYIITFKKEDKVAGISPANQDQIFAFDLLLNPAIQLVTLNGKAGTGKTLLALAAGCKLVLEDAVFQKLLVSRPVVPLGKDLGFLPGGVAEKMDPWMEPLYDNFDIIFSAGDKKHERQKRDIRSIIEGTALIQVEALSYIRGRSMPDQFLLVDEAQNLSPHEVKTIITRAGKNTKVILTGDPYQIDHPYLDANSNGLNYVVEKFKQSPIAGHITLVQGERSELAETAAQLL